jgi:hypothetical protein
MRPQMKTPILEGLGHRNDTVEAIKVARTLKLQDELDAKILRKQKPEPAPMLSTARVAVYHTQNGGRSFTPAQLRRGLKKERRHGSAIVPSTISEGADLSDWDPGECSCHINPPCAYCERGEYKEL